MDSILNKITLILICSGVLFYNCSATDHRDLSNSQPHISSGGAAKYSDRVNKIQCFIDDCSNYSKLNNKIPRRFSKDKICRIATYNVHYWTDPFMKHDSFNEILDVISHVNADILVLQEVAWGSTEFGSHTVNDILSKFKALGYEYYIFSEAHVYSNPTVSFGNVIFSKYSISTKFSKKFKAAYQGDSKNYTEGRSYAYALISLPSNENITIYGTHLDAFDISGDTRLLQIKELAAAIPENVQNVVLAADFNEERPTSLVCSWLQTLGYQDCFVLGRISNDFTPKFSTWNGTWIDFIYLKNWCMNIVGCYTYYNAASDHLPVIMDFAQNNTSKNSHENNENVKDN